MDNNEQKKQTEIIVVLDRSGSMGSIAQPTVDGFNTFLREQKAAQGEAFMTLVQFDDQYEINYKSLPIIEVPELIAGETYCPRGTTALYESVGRTINELQTDRDVVFVIITDGHDNVKSEFKPEAIKKMIETLEKDNGYKFLFLAANQDAITSGGSIGVKMANSMSYAATADGIGNTFHAMSSNIGNYRGAKSKMAASLSKEDFDSLLSKESIESLGFSDDQRKKSI